MQRFGSWRPIALLSVIAVFMVAMFALAISRQSASRSHPLAGATVAFVGDSYTAGAGAGAQDRGFVEQLAAAEDWDADNLGRGGTGYATSVSGTTAQQACGAAFCPSYREVIGEVVQRNPQVIVVSGGRNDAVVTAGDEGDAIRSFFTDLHRRVPHATILAVSPLWDSSAPPPSLRAIATVVKSEVKAVHGRYLDIGQPLRDRPGLIADDHIHPNDAGHATIAIAIEKALERQRLG